MANEKVNDKNHRYAVVSESVDAAGFYTDVVSPRAERIGMFFFSIRETGSGTSDVTVTLQFKCKTDTGWTDYLPTGKTEWKVGDRIAINECGAGVRWRAGVKENGHVSGSVTFGFDW